MEIRFLKALNGDCIHIRLKDGDDVTRNIVIDGGTGETYKQKKGKKLKPVNGELFALIENIRNENQLIDLLILTHHHDDHIKGILQFLESDKDALNLISEVWFNTGETIASFLNKEQNDALEHIISSPTDSTDTSVPYAIAFSKMVKDKLYPTIIVEDETIDRFGISFHILSPDKKQLEKLLDEWRKMDPNLETAGKPNDYQLSLSNHIEQDQFEEDTSPANGTSIAFRMEWHDKNFLFLADAHPGIIHRNLLKQRQEDGSPFLYEFVKLAHHGSAFNSSPELLAEITCDNYIISTNGDKHQHPHKRMVARLIALKPDCNIYFNYECRIDQLFSKEDYSNFPLFRAIPLTSAFQYDHN